MYAPVIRKQAIIVEWNMKFVDLSHKIKPPFDQFGGKLMIDKVSSYETDGYYDCAVYMGTHTGTHIESSLHFNKDGIPIEKTPLSDYYGKAVVLDLTHKKGRVDITSSDLKKAANKARVDLKKVRIVLVRTDLSKLWGTPEYNSNDRPSITVEAHEWLIKQGVKVIGVDMLVTERDRLGSDPSIKPSDPERWLAHCLMKKYNFYIIENLTNLDKIPKTYFTFVGFPLKFAGAGASPMRAVALIE